MKREHLTSKEDLTPSGSCSVGRMMSCAPPSDWLLLNSTSGAPDFNMALDEALLESMPRLQKPVLRFYGWTEPAASFGYFQKYVEVEHTTRLRPLIRRPTGGGIVPHDADWTYSLAFPPGHAWYVLNAVESYRRVHEWIRSAFARLQITTELAPCCKKSAPGQCFIGYEKSDVLWHGQKIAGAAQRRTRDGLLIQGSVQPPPLSLSRVNWEKAMCKVATLDEGTGWLCFTPDELLSECIDALIGTKYSQRGYNQKR